VRLVVPGAPQSWAGLGISVGVGFGVEAMDHTMEFYSVGCDFVIRPTP
jgi:voltage-gated potassium channel Kch